LTIKRSYNSIRYEDNTEKTPYCFGVVFLYTFRDEGVGLKTRYILRGMGHG